MELTLTDERLIDFGLNLLGYISAAAFSLVIYSIYFGRKFKNLTERLNGLQGITKRVEPMGASGFESMAEEPSMPDLSPGGRTFDPEYFSLGAADPTGRFTERFNMDQPSEPRSGSSQKFSRNRSEVIRLARKMLEAGNSAERVADLLPITESEMRLVALGARPTV